jgi:hypothetical protein
LKSLSEKGAFNIINKLVLPAIPVQKLAEAFCGNNGRPTKDIRTMAAMMFLQEAFDYSDEETRNALAFDQRVQWALNIFNPTDENALISQKSFSSFRKRMIDNDLAEVLLVPCNIQIFG